MNSMHVYKSKENKVKDRKHVNLHGIGKNIESTKIKKISQVWEKSYNY